MAGRFVCVRCMHPQHVGHCMATVDGTDRGGLVLCDCYDERTSVNKKLTPITTTTEAVDHPSHYTTGGIEVISVITAWGLDFPLGNAVKYIARAGKKDPTKTKEDLLKAAWYLQYAIKQLELKEKP